MVTFDMDRKVILIPTSREYREAGVKDDIWWQKNDLEGFKDSTVEEIRRLRAIDGSLSIEQVQIILYEGPLLV